MAQVINTNIMSLTARNNLNKSQSSLATAMERLSSGLRINSSKDDAAGYAISTRMSTQINGLQTAARNANDAVSLAQTASAALQQVTDNLQTIRQLAVQAANATNSQSDRDALDAEVQQRLAEITRVSQQTTFNGRRILDGSFGNAAFQVGANVGETISINLNQGTQASKIGSVATVTDNVSSVFAGLHLGASDLSVAVGSGTAVAIASGTYSSASGLVAAINTAAGSTVASVDGNEIKITAPASGGVVFTGGEASDLGLSTVTSGTTADSTGVNTAVTATSGGSVTLTAGQLTINGTDVTGTFKSAQALADGINATGIQGVTSYLSSGGSLVIQTNGTADNNGSTAGGVDGITIAGSALPSGITAGTTTDGLSLANANGAGASGSVNVKSVAGANDTINRIDSALASVSSIDSQLGAMQNRFDSAISDAKAVSQNLSASRSRIEDADFAAETAAMSKSQILQQAGISMLAQANAAPQLVLKLLQ